MTDVDLLAPGRSDRIVSGSALAAALRRKRGTILALVIIGALLGLAVGTLVPTRKTASTTLLLRFPPEIDPAQAIATDLTLLTTRPVAQGALAALHSNASPDSLRGQYRGEVLSTAVMRITANGSDATAASRRADAIATSFLDFRAQLFRQQLDTLVSGLRAQETDLQHQQASLSEQIRTFNPKTATQGAQLDDLVTARANITGQLQQIQTTIDTDTVSLNSAPATSRVIDPATVTAKSTKKTAALDILTGLLVGLVLGIGGVLLVAIVSTRVRRRADVAATLHAPVTVSVGAVVPTGWRRRLGRRAPTPDRPNADLQMVVRSLQSALATAPTRALLIVAIDSLRVATLAMQTLEQRLVAEGHQVSIVNETGHDLPPQAESNGDVVLVLAVLDPAKGAEHLREWATTAVAFVTAGRSTREKLEAQATMLRNASLELHSVVLIDADRTDDSLGIVETPPAPAAEVERAERGAESTIGMS
jgi:hypothetical protein